MIKKFFKKYDVLGFFERYYEVLDFFKNKRNVKWVVIIASVVLLFGAYKGEIVGVILVVIGVVVIIFSIGAYLIHALTPRW
jgi:hypothetical protein